MIDDTKPHTLADNIPPSLPVIPVEMTALLQMMKITSHWYLVSQRPEEPRCRRLSASDDHRGGLYWANTHLARAAFVSPPLPDIWQCVEVS